MEFSFGLRELLIAVVLASAIYLIEVWLFARRRRSSSSGDPALRAEVEALRQAVRRLEARLSALEQGQGREAPHAQAEAVVKSNAQYDQPARYAREGLSAAEIANRCGISRAEAELLVALYGPKGGGR